MSQVVVNRRASGTLSRQAELTLGAVGLIGLVLLWQVASVTGLVSERVVPAPTDVAGALGRLVTTGDFWGAVWATVSITVIGMVVILLIAVPAAMAIHASRIVEHSTWFLIEFLKPIPGVALIPLALLLWGPTDGVKLFLIVFGSLWPMLTQLVYGLREIPGLALEMARVYRFGFWQRIHRITIPSVLPFTLTGLRISVTIALIIAIVTEYIVGMSGLGSLLALAQLNGVVDQAFALLLVSGLLGLAFSGAVAALSGPLLFWHPSQRERRNA
ncbi:ABC transporter permease [Phytoactinopolyspora endophytica]|uniref:ABC transporter permease n=1 Tax=Phytoactinopolyspora endophytica TaxID=1642495 RepID=UPI00101D352C|nr:ABC transporter permease [Phytoactinopolyspora endophytica]